MDKAKFIIFLLICSLSFISCQHLSKEIINEEEDFNIQIKIDSLFMRFDIEKYKQTQENNKKNPDYLINPTPLVIIDSIYYVNQGELFDESYSQYVYTLGDSLFYDEYNYYPDGMLRNKSRHFINQPAFWDIYYEFDEKGTLVTLVEYEKSKNLDLTYLIDLVKKHQFNFSDEHTHFWIDYRKKEEYQKEELTYIKYTNPIWQIQITNLYGISQTIQINPDSGEVELDCFHDKEFVVYQKGTKKDVLKDSSFKKRTYLTY